MILSSFSFSDRGGREENQDSIGLLEADGAAIYVLADGLGGHSGGSEASSQVVHSLVNAWRDKRPVGTEAMKNWIKEQLAAVNDALLKKQEEQHKQMRSTVVMLLLEEGQAVWANTGDSRLYQIREGQLWHVTEDHSMAYHKFKMGEISRDRIAGDADQSQLLRALGNSERWQPDIRTGVVKSGDAFLLCSDGLWEYLDDNEILIDSLKAEKPKRWGHLLLTRAIARVADGNDNLSLITVMVG